MFILFISLTSERRFVDLSANSNGSSNAGVDFLNVLGNLNNINVGSINIDILKRFNCLGNIRNTFDGGNNLAVRGNFGNLNVDTTFVTEGLEILQ